MGGTFIRTMVKTVPDLVGGEGVPPSRTDFWGRNFRKKGEIKKKKYAQFLKEMRKYMLEGRKICLHPHPHLTISGAGSKNGCVDSSAQKIRHFNTV
jgi:hypothetical protein